MGLQSRGPQQTLPAAGPGGEQGPVRLPPGSSGIGQGGQRLVTMLRADWQQVNAQQALATEGQPEQHVLLDIPGVVVHHFEGTRPHDTRCPVGQVAFQTATAQQSCLPTVRRKQHERAGFGIGRPFGQRHHRQTTNAGSSAQRRKQFADIRAQKRRAAGCAGAQSRAHGKDPWKFIREV